MIVCGSSCFVDMCYLVSMRDFDFDLCEIEEPFNTDDSFIESGRLLPAANNWVDGL